MQIHTHTHIEYTKSEPEIKGKATFVLKTSINDKMQLYIYCGGLGGCARLRIGNQVKLNTSI